MVRNFLLLLFATLILVSPAASEERLDPATGGWESVKHNGMGKPCLHEIAAWAVAEYNKNSQPKLELLGLDSAYTQVVEGMRYRIRMQVRQNPDVVGTYVYETLIWDKPWLGFRQMHYLRPA